MIVLKNNTGAVSKIGYIVKADPKDANSFIYASSNETNIIGVVAQAVKQHELCDVANSGRAKVYVQGGCTQGQVIRSRKTNDRISNGAAKRALTTDTPYYNIGTALESLPRNGLVLCELNLYHTGGTATSAYITEEFETISKNLRSYPYEITYDGDDIDYITYTLGGGQEIVKTFNYTVDQLTSIVLSGATPYGIELTKTLTYTGDDLTGVSYS